MMAGAAQTDELAAGAGENVAVDGCVAVVGEWDAVDLPTGFVLGKLPLQRYGMGWKTWSTRQAGEASPMNAEGPRHATRRQSG